MGEGDGGGEDAGEQGVELLAVFGFVVAEVGDVVFVTFEVEIVVLAKQQFGAVDARHEGMGGRVGVVVHEAVEHGLEGCLVAGGVFGVENGGYGFEGGGVGTCFVVDDADAVLGLVNTVDVSTDVDGLRMAFDFGVDGYTEAVFHSEDAEGTEFPVVLEHFTNVFFDHTQDEFITAAVHQFGDSRSVYFQIGGTDVLIDEFIVAEQCIDGFGGDEAVGDGGV